jgi:hypothetical protein
MGICWKGGFILKGYCIAFTGAGYKNIAICYQNGNHIGVSTYGEGVRDIKVFPTKKAAIKWYNDNYGSDSTSCEAEAHTYKYDDLMLKIAEMKLRTI